MASTTDARASELKEQGAIEAAADPAQPVTAADAERTIVEEAKKAGSAAYQFDPDASAAEKAAQVKAEIPPGLTKERNPRASALVTDIDDGTGAEYDLPSPSRAGVVEPGSLAQAEDANGALSEEDKETWEKVGWAPRFGMPKVLGEDEDASLLDHQTMLEGKLSETLYGDWYHNTGIIIFASLTNWVVGILGGGLGWVFIILAFCGTYYRTSIRRVRRNFRDDISREMAKTKLETDTETLEWINSFLLKFWPIYAPVLCKTIVSSVDQVLSVSTPPFLEGLRMKTFTLGTKPPRLEHVKTYPRADDDIVLMDWKFSFTPNDTADMTARQINIKENPKVVLEVRVGKGVVSKGLDVIVEDMACTGLIRVKVKLQLPFPHIERVDISFLGRPEIDYVCKPIGGDIFGLDMGFIPGLQSFIMEMIHGTLAPMMYDPNVFPIEVAKMLAGTPVDQAIGVLQVTFHGAQGLKNSDKLAGTPDPYAVVSINNRAELARTKTIYENANPRWGETINVIVSSLKDSLTVPIYDYNQYRNDKELGVATFPLEKLEDDTEHENLQLEVTANGKARGVIQCDVRFFPVLGGRKLDNGTVEAPPESSTGICRFNVEQAKALDGTKSLVGALNPYAVLLLNGKEVQTSHILKRTNNPIWSDAHKELLITNRKTAKLGLVIKDDRDITVDPIVGSYQIKLDDLIDLSEKGQEWYNLSGAKTGRVKMSAQWKPVALKGALGGSGGYVTPIGVLRFHFRNAQNLPNVETLGKSDPYVRVLLSSLEKGRTVTFKNNLNPDWDEVLYVPVHTPKEKLLIEVMDSENMGRDRQLGHIELSAADYVFEDVESGEFNVYEPKSYSHTLRSGHGVPGKGTLNYSVGFYPTLHVVDPDEEEEERAKESMDGAPRPSHETGESTPKTSVENGRRSAESAATPDKRLSSLKSNGNGKNSMESDDGAIGHVVRKEPPKIRLTSDVLQQYDCGLIIFKLIDGRLAEADCHLEVLMDDNVFPAYTSSKVKNRTHTFNETGDAMVRELESSQITLRLVEEVDKKGEGKGNNVVAKLSGPTIDTLRRCLYTPTELTMSDEDGRQSKVTVSLKYLPVKMRLDPSESFNNQGELRVEVVDAADLPAADRNGYSDPFCKFVLNGKSVHKTETQKKTLHPAWNEIFTVSIKSRTAAKFEVDVYDWDFGDSADFLGKAAINLDALEPFQKQEVTLGLDGKSGVVRLRILFKPSYVMRTRQGSSTFQGTFAKPGTIVGAPIKGVGKGAVLVGGSVIKGASFIRHGFKGKKSKPAAVPDEDSTLPSTTSSIDGNGNGAATPERRANDPLPSIETTPSPYAHTRHKSSGAASYMSGIGGSPGGADMGVAHVAILAASGYPTGTNVRVHVHTVLPKAKEILKTKAQKLGADGGDVRWDGAAAEEVKLSAPADAQFKLVVKDHSTWKVDDELGEAAFFIDDQGTSEGVERSVVVGGGTVVLKTWFVAADAEEGGKHGGSLSPGKALRKGPSVLRRDRSATPA
ncbi:tricalbin [Eremomyces bilateralis CBS 781.70]|uniref:Tricalbin n=1 Tax=Eremomyces bilateralis CBS 781.70 TaxID=1392243 RepID=A0A6G1FYG1_9PEZI|nr:tricalbin [Eremomyces bilateralis CBS 781.70]KAF1810740.1 tricalbin [Eremomyces bilateralis CBS 781.70]